MATTSLEFVITAVDRASKVLKGVGASAETAGGKVSRFGPGAKVALAAVGVAAIKFASDSVQAYADAETAQARLTDAFAKFPALADTNIGALRNLNTALATKTRFDDDATASGQAVLAQFGLTGDQLTQITPLLQDYAAKTGKDLPSAAKDLGKAVLGQGKALKNIGLKFKDAGSASGNFDQLMGGLRSQVGGFATKEGATAAGKAEILKNQFGELQETVGGKLMPVLQTLVDVGLKVVGWISSNVSWLGPLAVGIGIIAVVTKAWSVAQLLINAAMTANPIGIVVVAIALLVAGVIYAYNKFSWFKDFIDTVWSGIQSAAQAVASWFTDTLVPWFGDVWEKIKAFFSGAWDFIKKVFAWTPLGLVITNWGAITDWFKSMWDKIKGFFSLAWDFIKKVFAYTPLGIVVTNFGAIVDWFKGLPGKIGGALGALADKVAAPFKSAFGAIARLWNNTIAKISFTIPAWLPGGGKTFSVPKIPGYAKGTNDAAPGWGWVGENGPELMRFRGGEQVMTTSESRAAAGPHETDLSERSMRALLQAAQIIAEGLATGSQKRARSAASSQGLRPIALA